jgi:hypothetical protein
MIHIKASLRLVLWMVLADLPIILIPVLLYLRSHNYHLLLIPLPAGLIVNAAIGISGRKTLQRTTNA